MICSKCGYTNDEDSRYCRKCGNQLQANRNQSKRAGLVVGAILILVLAASVAAGYFFINQDNDLQHQQALVNNTTNATQVNVTQTNVNKNTSVAKKSNKTKSSKEGINGIGKNGIRYYIPADHKTCNECGGPLGFYYINKVNAVTGEHYVGEYFGCLREDNII